MGGKKAGRERAALIRRLGPGPIVVLSRRAFCR
jgi:hypothetical protein